MKKRQHQEASPVERSSAHLEHLGAHEDHSRWLKELERWREEYAAAVLEFVRLHLPQLELAMFEPDR